MKTVIILFKKAVYWKFGPSTLKEKVLYKQVS